MDIKTIEELIFFGIEIILYILFMIAEWRILTKAGEKGYKSLIPFYNIYISHKIVGMSHVWFIVEMILWVGEVVDLFVRFNKTFDIIFLIVTLVFTMTSAVVHVLKICKCFGKRTAFKIGMLLLPDLFMLIIAFGKSTYTKPEKSRI